MIPKAEFGRTGHHSTRVVFGAASLSSVTQKVADQTLEVLLRYGVNHIDTAAAYGDSEVRIASWLRREPGHFFLATKGDKRDEKGAREEIQRSLDRLEVDHVDLWQLRARSGASRCRPSSQSLRVREWSRSTPAPRGTDRWRILEISTLRSGGQWAGGASF